MNSKRRFPRLHLFLIIAVTFAVFFLVGRNDNKTPVIPGQEQHLPLDLGITSSDKQTPAATSAKTEANITAPELAQQPPEKDIVVDAKLNDTVGSDQQQTNSTQSLPAEVATAAPERELTLELEPQDPASAFATPPPISWKPDYKITTNNYIVKSGDTLTSIFKRFDIPQKTLFNLLSVKGTKALSSIKVGEEIAIDTADDGRFVGLRYSPEPTKTIVVTFVNDQFVVENEHYDVEFKTRFGSAEIESSLFLAGEKAGLSHALIMEMANMFGWDIDFALDIRQGDTFRVLYHEQWVKGRKIKDGPILIAEFINQGDAFQAIRYTDHDGNSNYYTPEGLSMRKAFLRAPLNFNRISSHFNLRRKHPVLHTIRAHKGTDYAAPTGTPVWASGDGKINFAGWNGGYGKVVVIQHGQKYATKYAHLSKIKPGIKAGKKVRQGQIIGYVGTTGRSTGPHLHYEFLVNGVHRNSRTIKLPQAEPIAKKEKEDFTRHSAKLVQDLDNATRLAAHSNTE